MPAPAPTGNPTADQHLGKLASAGNSREQFDKAFSDLKADKSVNKATLTTISQSYGSHVFTNLSKDGLHKEIERAFVRNARFLNKIRGAGLRRIWNKSAQEYVAELFSAAADRQAFDRTFQEIKKDNSLSKSDVAKITSDFALPVYEKLDQNEIYSEIERFFKLR